jgi:crotonobetainyl-CoA:carnitine CoA-transferase CaiB-like acyl-CoA transferase
MSAYRVLGYQQPRLGSGIAYSVPRGTYQCADGHWVAVSTSAETVAQRVMALIGVGDDPRFATFEGRIANREEVDRLMSDWIGARTQADVLAVFEEAHAAIAPILDMQGIAHDPHYAARESIIEVDSIPMQGLVARLSATPGEVRWAGRSLGADTAEIVSELE